MALGPVIALLMQPTLHGSMTPASYVKWLEMAGARVALLPYDADDSQVDAVFKQVNGALWIGGEALVPPSARRMYANAVAAYKVGDIFPIWGTCDGFEWMLQIAAENDSVLTTGFDAEDLPLPLNLTAAASDSRLLSECSSMLVGARQYKKMTIRDALSTLPITPNSHHMGVTPADFARFAPLVEAFSVLATNVDRRGKPFVSLMEAKHGLPFWGSQFHPEKSIFEQGRRLPGGEPAQSFDHSPAAVAVSQYFANTFVDACRESKHAFASATDEWESLVYQYSPTTAYQPFIVQSYFVDGPSKTPSKTRPAQSDRAVVSA